MKAMVLKKPGLPLQLKEIPVPTPGRNQLLLQVKACGVCRTDLHIIDGELDAPKLPLVLGHQIVGVVESSGAGASRFVKDARVGVSWLGAACGECRYCKSGRENLCEKALFTGYTVDGGLAQYVTADERFCFAVPDGFSDLQAAPLLCAGLIGYRAYTFTGNAEKIGFYGFGVSAHILCQLATHQEKRVFAFTRPGDTSAQVFARKMGAVWAGDSTSPPPEELDAAIIFASVGSLVSAALMHVVKGGTVVCAGIHMSDIPSFPYEALWGERVLRSVANFTRSDGREFLALAPAVPIETVANAYPLAGANNALEDFRSGAIAGAAVVLPWL